MVLVAMAQDRIADPFEQAVLLWNRGLLFEVHERLEAIWQDVAQERRKAIKGVIQAIAAYLHGQCGHREIATRLAGKAADLLRQYGPSLPPSFKYGPIVSWLQQPDLGPPPRL
jgi:predicted metal-dependent hydrolase